MNPQKMKIEEAISILKSMYDDIVGKIDTLEKRIERIEGRSGILQPQEITSKRIINKTTLMRGALMAIGGKGKIREWKNESDRIKRIARKDLSSVPSHLEKRGEVIRKGETYEIVDWLMWCGMIKKESEVFEYVKNKIVSDDLIQNKSVFNIVLTYAKNNNTFHIKDFLNIYENICSKEIRNVIEKNLPKVTSELSAKGIVELIEGLDGGVLVSNRPIARISYKEIPNE